MEASELGKNEATKSALELGSIERRRVRCRGAIEEDGEERGEEGGNRLELGLELGLSCGN